jgi:hypothetical protein
MAIAAATVWEVRTMGNAANGGGYSTGGTDYSQQDAAQLSVTDAAATGTTNLSSATGGFTSAMVGNIVNVVGQGRRQITTYVDTNNVTCDAAWGTFSGATANVGGALIGPEDADASYVPGNIVYIEEGSYTSTTTRTLTCDGTVAGHIRFVGYPSGGARSYVDIAEADMPVFTSATNSVDIFSHNNANRIIFRNIKITHTAATRGDGVAALTTAGSGFFLINCVFDGCLSAMNDAGLNWSALYLTRSTIRNCTSNGITFTGSGSNITCYYNTIVDNGARGIRVNGAGIGLYFNIIAGNTNEGYYNVSASGTSAFLSSVIGNVFHGNGGDGFHMENSSGGFPIFFFNNILTSNGAYGARNLTANVFEARNGVLARKNAYYNNATGDRLNFATGEDDITLTGDPFTNSGAGDFSLNNTADRGAALRALGFPATIGPAGATTANYIDIGASQVDPGVVAPSSGNTAGFIETGFIR